MKDYMMWLDSRGVAKWSNSIGELIVPHATNIYSQKLVDEYKDDETWHSNIPDIDCQWNPMCNAYNQPTIKLDDDDYIIIDEDEEVIIDDGDLDDCAWSPTDYWFRTDGGLTGAAMNFLYTLDSQGELV